MPNLNIAGKLQIKRFGDVRELFLGDRPVPFYADVQQIVRRLGDRRPIARMTIGDALHVEGHLDVFCQRRGQFGLSNVLERRFAVDGFDLQPVLQDGITVQLELIL